MYQIRTIMFVFLSLLLLTACGDDKVTKDCVAAYNRATEKIMQAENSEQLLEISYALHLELVALKVVDKSGESGSVADARGKFEKAVKNREVEFYTAARKRK